MKRLLKSYIYILILIASIGCTNSENSSFLTNNLLVPENLDFGSVEKSVGTVIKNLIIVNNETEPVLINPLLDGTSFKIIYSNCGNLKVNKSCTLKISFDKSQTVGSHQNDLTIGSSTVSLTGVITGSSEVADVKVYEAGIEVSELDFGELSGSQSVIKTIVFSNEGNKKTEVGSLSYSSGFDVISNSCSAGGIKARSSCSVRVLFSAQGKSNQVYSGTLSIGSSSINLEGTVISSAPVPENLVFIDGNVEVSSIDLGDIPNKLIKNISIKNKGALSSSELNVSLDSTHYIKIFDSCSGKQLKGQESCLVKIYIADKPEGSYPLNLSVNGETLAVSGNIGNILAQLAISVPEHILKDSCTPLSVGLRTLSNQLYVPPGNVAITSLKTLYSDSSCLVESSVIEAGVSDKTFYIKEADLGNQNISFLIETFSEDYDFIVYDELSLGGGEITTDNSLNLVPAGGVAPYTYEVISGGGSISTGTYTPSSSGNVVVKVIDSILNEAQATIIVREALSLSLGTCNDARDGVSCSLNYTGGVGAITVDGVTASGGSHAFQKTCTDLDVLNQGSLVEAEDSLGNTSSVVVDIRCSFPSCNYLKAKIDPPSGEYLIDSDGKTSGRAPVPVLCDMDNNGGGWDIIVDPAFSPAEQITNLTNLGTYSNISGTYTRAGQGVSWGTNNSLLSVYKIEHLAEIVVADIIYSGSYIGGLGFFYVSEDAVHLGSDTNLGVNLTNPRLRFNDAHADNITGQSLSVNGVTIFNLSTTNVVDRNDQVIGNMKAYTMNGYSGYIYTRRYIKSLKVRARHYELPKSCLDAKERGFLNTDGNSGDGFYLIDSDGFNNGNPPAEMYCEMTTDGGGWTLAFRGDNLNYNTTTSQFTDAKIMNEATEVMTYYVGLTMVPVSTRYKISKPANFNLWTVSNGVQSVSIVNLDNSYSGTVPLYYGNMTFATNPCDAFSSGAWGKFTICTTNSNFFGFPFYSGYNNSDADYCSYAQNSFNTHGYCTQNRKIAIFAR